MTRTADTYEADYFRSRYDPRRVAMMHAERWRIGVDRGVVLDYGCGTGEFLEFFDDSWTRCGYDVSLYALNVCQERGIEVFLPAGDEWCDLVVMRGVLQHLPDPVGALELAYRRLKPGGVLAILATPNAGSLHYRIHQDLPALDPPKNYIVFSAKTLRQTLLNLGFQEPNFHFPYWGTPYAQPVRDLLRFVTGRKTAFWGNQMECFAVK